MSNEGHQSILSGIGPDPGAHRRGRRADLLVRGLGILLVLATGALIVAGPSLMSRGSYTAFELFAIIVYAAYAIYVAARSRSTHVNLERAYSANLEELSQRLRTMAYRDSLTGLYNHRYFYEQLSHEIERSLRYGQPLTVLLMDMNNFKEINDTFGHIIGDKFLSLVGQVISRQIRGSDIGARYGGDEFVVILPNTALEEARLTAEKLSAAVEHAAALNPGEEQVKLGISIGIAVCPDDSRAAGELLQMADGRLYEQKAARKSGRGRSNVA
ncbi:MAG: GGDEF domain-containing protein [Chloroflexi bacterium]|nr:GGDEF domain-containing protein [Chloroflexota bacterium]